MKSQFVTHKLAQDLKDLGFDQPCMGVVYPDGEVTVGTPDFVKIVLRDDKEGALPAPMILQAAKWLLDEYDVRIGVTVHKKSKKEFDIHLYHGTSDRWHNITYDYCFAFEAALMTAIMMIRGENGFMREGIQRVKK